MRDENGARYEPGTCNIGRDERRKRLRFGIGSAGLGVVYLGAVWYLSLPDGYALGIAIFVYSAILNYVQYRRGFCVSLGVLGQYDFSGAGGPDGTVHQAPYRRRDRRRAYELSLYTLGGTIAVTLVVYLAFTGLAR